MLDEIRIAPERPASRKKARGWVQAAAGAGLAATVTLAAAGCKEKSHPTEMVAIPTATASGPPLGGEADATPPADAAEITPPLGPAALIKPSVGKQLLPVLVREIVPAQTVELEIWIAADGTVSKAILQSPKVEPETEARIVNAARALTFSAQNVREQRFVLSYSQAEVASAAPDAAARPPPAPMPTHMKERVPRPEMAPRPPPPRPEMAPRPPKPDKPGPGF